MNLYHAMIETYLQSYIRVRIRSKPYFIETIHDFKTIPPKTEYLIVMVGCNSNDIIPESVKHIYFYGCLLLEFPKLPSKLLTMEIIKCSTHMLPELPNDLEVLIASNSSLIALPNKLPNNLRVLIIDRNFLRKLPKLPDTIELLYCENNHLSKIDLPKNLMILRCQDNKFPILKIDQIDFNKYKNIKTSIMKRISNIFRKETIKILSIPRLPKSVTSFNDIDPDEFRDYQNYIHFINAERMIYFMLCVRRKSKIAYKEMINIRPILFKLIL